MQRIYVAKYGVFNQVYAERINTDAKKLHYRTLDNKEKAAKHKL